MSTNTSPRVAVVGYGYWGPKLIAALKRVDPDALRVVCERNKSLHSSIQTSNPGIEIMSDYEDVFRRTDIDAVILATGPAMHFTIAKSALEYGKHVLVEKPLTLHVHEAAQNSPPWRIWAGVYSW